MSVSVKEVFINLTKKTMPAGNEHLALPYLPSGLKKDFHGNYYMKIGSDPTVMFASHLDTADSGLPKDVVHVIDGNIIKTDGKTILGADDKAGVALMVYMIDKKVPGLYYFFLSEERGCVGSRAVSSYIEKNKTDSLYKNITKVISFDRKDDFSIITHQLGERCCSEEFSKELASRLNSAGGFKYKSDDTGSVTDSHHFADKISECTNLSVGYDAQHTSRESQDIEFLSKLAEACCKIDWETLPVKRDYTKIEYKSYGRSSYSGYHSGGGSYNRWDSDSDDWWEKNTGFSTRKQNQSKNTTAEYVKDYLGNTIKTADAVWCEYDKEWCLKSEAIWVNYIGFYTCPDFDPSKVKKEDDQSGNYVEITNDDLKVGTELYRSGKLFGKITEIGEDDGHVTISTGEKSKFICPIEKILNNYKFEKKIESNLKDLKESDVKTELIIHHPIFGIGKIVSVKPDKKVVKISFKDKGTKDIRVDMSNMKF